MTQSSIPTPPSKTDEEAKKWDMSEIEVNTDERLLAQVFNTLSEVQTVISGEHISSWEEKPNHTK